MPTTQSEKKRFEHVVSPGGHGLFDNGKYVAYYDCCDLLNSLHEENEKLKSIIEEYKFCKEIVKSMDQTDEKDSTLKDEKETKKITFNISLPTLTVSGLIYE